jgi:mono/diheme cytochrome c family protein
MRTGKSPSTVTLPRARLGRAGLLLVGCLALASGCRKDMYDQPKYKEYDPSTSFRDGTSSRPIAAGTIARGELHADKGYYDGKTAKGEDVDVFPFPVTKATIELGRERYQVFCTPCHGRTGDGNGMVVRRGFSPPPSFHAEYLRKIKVGHFYDVITHGYGAMYSYAARIPVDQRWAIAAYIRVLQYSRDARPEDLTPEERKSFADLISTDSPTRLAEAPR